jgi:formylglycine-generating enzyme required for sulfatase activity
MTANAEQARDTELKTTVFISYSRKDMTFVDRLEVALRARGFAPLVDREEIYAFEDWWRRIEALIGRTDTVVFVLSPDAVKSEVALKEVTYAASLNKRLAPIVCRHVEDRAVPDLLRRLNFIFFDDGERFDASADTLSEALKTDIVWIRDHTKYGEAARTWAAASRPSGLLLRTPALEMAEYWIASRPAGAPEPTEDSRAFIAASRQAARSSQRLRRIVSASIFTLMAATILVLVGWINQGYLITQWRWYTITRPYAAAQIWPYVLSAAKEQELRPGDSFKECARDCPEMIVMPAASFTMGDGKNDAYPPHTVTFAKAFAVSKYEVTFADWDGCLVSAGCDGYRPSDQGWGRGRQPIINVNWDDAQKYIAWLSQLTGKPYRLLSEAEYEYGACAGATTTYPWGDTIKLNDKPMTSCHGCGSEWDGRQPAPVGSFPPNKFGLYDMVGNVWELTEDCNHVNYDGAPTDGSAWIKAGDCTKRIVRSSSGLSDTTGLRCTLRVWGTTDNRRNDQSFRVGRTLNTR